MPSFAAVAEQRMRVLRWGLLVGWLLLIASLLIPAIQLPAWLLPAFLPELETSCFGHRQPGNRLFWGTVVPPALIGVVSSGGAEQARLHHDWPRRCSGLVLPWQAPMFSRSPAWDCAKGFQGVNPP